MSTAANKGAAKRARSTDTPRPLLRAERQIDRINLDGYIDLPADVCARIRQDYRDGKTGSLSHDLCEWLARLDASERGVRAAVARAAVRKGRAPEDRRAARALPDSLATLPPVTTPPF